MARATYLAPGVYVEEVPSAQQPIAGVGTNTAAFIGWVPEDRISYPKLNEKYDPVRAKIDLADPPERRKQRRQQRLADLEAEKQNVESDLQQANAELIENQEKAGQPTPDPEADNASQINREIRKAEKKVAALQERISGLNQRILTIDAEMAGINESPESYRIEFTRYYDMKVFPDQDEGENMAPPLKAVLCTNFSEYTRRFGPFSADDPDPQKEPGTALHRGHRSLTHAVNGFFINGGTKCYVVRIKAPADLKKALELIESIDAVAIVAAPGLPVTQTVWNDLQNHCDKCKDRFAVLDCPADVKDEQGELDVNLLDGTDENYIPTYNKNSAYYFPYIKVNDPAKQMQDHDPVRKVEMKRRGNVFVPPSGHVAGIYSRTDEERGVHKAPANAVVRGALGVKYYVGKPRQELLNPHGVNCIRDLNGAIKVWGARTIGGDSNGEWKYVSVRRFFLFLRESIDEGTQWVVFEPNDRALWGKIRRNLSAFLTNVWRSGALFGSSPQEAFYVKCDDETNPPERRDVGQVVTEIGVAIVRPAEFVIFRITQSTGGENT